MTIKYQHQFVDGSPCALLVGKAVCVGLNYAAHAAEMHSQQSSEPLLFIKPRMALVSMDRDINIPVDLGDCHYETEMAILIGRCLSECSEAEAQEGIVGVGLALDLTLRSLQTELKNKGQPWEKAKAWDGACPLSSFVKPDKIDDLQAQTIRLYQNGTLRQDGNTKKMLRPVLPLISHMSRFFTLEPGDVVLTGTPDGVGPIEPGDNLRAELGDVLTVDISVALRQSL